MELDLSFLDRVPVESGSVPWAAGAVDGIEECDQDSMEGRRMGPYLLLERLGEGGMGVVFLAEQKEPVARRLALKLIRSSFARDGAASRFAAEQRAMARFSHPNIAKIFDAGTTEDGIPYFAMEFVDGVVITDFCDQKRLSLEERISLLMDVCRAVEHAHQRGIIHRDLKPANILVEEHGDQPVVKVIDFGISKVVDPDLTSHHTLTREGVVGTPAYMSPETFASDEAPDTRTDVYALGMLLYELLVGNHPFLARDMGLMQVMQRVLAGDFALPSKRLGLLDQRMVEEAAQRRGLSVSALRRRVRGDLDWIVARSTAVEREERYPSVAALIVDLRRHLGDRPVSAGPPRWGYRLRKFVRRHRFAVATTLGIFLATLLGLLGTGFGLVQARQAEARALAQAERAISAEARAQQEARVAKEVTDFLVQLFQVPVEERSGGQEMHELLSHGAMRIRRERIDQPLVQVRSMAALGAIYQRLGDPGAAHDLLAEALWLGEKHLGPEYPEVLEIRETLRQLDPSEDRGTE